MWVESLPSSLGFNAFTAVCSPPKSNAVAATGKIQQRRLLPNDGDRDSAKGLRSLGRKTFKPIGPQNTMSTGNSHSEKPKLQHGQGRELRGSDVLLALQKASARKIKKKERDSLSAIPKESANDTIRESRDDDFNYSNVRSLPIRSDWSARLDELEARLRELADTA